MAADLISLGLAAVLLASGTPAIVNQAGPHVLVGGPVAARALAYGREPQQRLTLFTRARAGRAPLIVYLHGGGWSAGAPDAGSTGAQPDHFTGQGYAYATVAYRFVPGVKVEEQMADLARAIGFLRKQKGVDPRRIVLIGHSSGGHMAALLGTDPDYLEQAGVPFDALKAVVLLDPAALDIAPIMAFGRGGTIEAFYGPAFGNDPTRRDALSPIRRVVAPNAPFWLMLHDVNNPLAGMQSEQFSVGLIAAGAREAMVQAVPNTTHVRLNDEIGRPGDEATAAINAFLGRTFPETRRPRFR
jgi:arylformamidase